MMALIESTVDTAAEQCVLMNKWGSSNWKVKLLFDVVWAAFEEDRTGNFLLAGCHPMALVVQVPCSKIRLGEGPEVGNSR